jgi:hypothetical protein
VDVSALAAAAGLEVDLRTAHTPPIVWAPDDAAPSSSASSGGGWSLREAFLRWLRPEVTIRSAFGTVHRAPYGPAGDSSWPVVAVVASLVVLVVLTLAGIGLAVLGRRIVGR